LGRSHHECLGPVPGTIPPAGAETAEQTTTLELDLNGRYAELCGPGDANLRLLEELTGVRLILRDNRATLSGEGDAVTAAGELLTDLARAAAGGHTVTEAEVRSAVANLAEPPQRRHGFDEIVGTDIPVGARKVVKPRTAGQKRLIEALLATDITLAIGPAGTGKTYLSVAMGLSYLHRGLVDRLVLARPAVEAGESLGYLPGAPEEKIAPYLRPLYDALYAMLRVERIRNLIEHGVIEIVPLAYMRGRTLNNAYVILDEAQNCTQPQMKMFLTRLGTHSRAAVVGDITQIDLPDPAASGLVLSQKTLAGIEGISFVYLTKADIVRHGLVARIIEAYERFDDEGRRGEPG
jgi:phosphate starvation-inducible PhoH-like protein